MDISVRSLAAVGLGVAIALSGCTQDPPRRDVTVPNPPLVFADRTPLPDCGAVTIEPGSTPLTGWSDDIIDCLGGPEGGEVGEVSYTTEGDLIWAYYRAGPGIRGVEIFTDYTEDTYGTQAWTHSVCPGAAAADLLGGRLSCTEPVWLVAD